MTHKYTAPCPHCGSPTPRQPTPEERARDAIEKHFAAAYQLLWSEGGNGWPGTGSLATRCINDLKALGVKFE